jgi:hypothetical protein
MLKIKNILIRRIILLYIKYNTYLVDFLSRREISVEYLLWPLSIPEAILPQKREVGLLCGGFRRRSWTGADSPFHFLFPFVL